MFGKGNDFAKKITHKADNPDQLISAFRNSYNPRVAVTVDMIATGTDIKPVEALIFMRDVRSSLYFEQMKGRGVRTINDADLHMVTPDAVKKERFILIDAVGVTESIKQVAKPLERKRDVTFDKLLEQVASGRNDPDLVSTLAGRLASLDRKLTDEDRAQIIAASGGYTLQSIASVLLDSIDNDKVVEAAPPPLNDKAMDETATAMREQALRILADAPKLRRLLIDLKSQSEIIIDEFSRDAVISAGFDENAAKAVTAKFSEFLDTHQDELAALTILYGKPHRSRRLTYHSVDELRAVLAKPPWLLEPISLWGAYKRLSGGKITADPGRVLTDIVALVRYALGQSDALQPLSADVTARFNLWIGREEKAGRVYAPEQRAWLEAIRVHVAANVDVNLRDLQEQPSFVDRGGVIAARRAFGDRLNAIIEELPEALVA